MTKKELENRVMALEFAFKHAKEQIDFWVDGYSDSESVDYLRGKLSAYRASSEIVQSSIDMVSALEASYNVVSGEL